MPNMSWLRTCANKTILAAALTALGLAGGCRAGIEGKITNIPTVEEFDRTVNQPNRPVMVDFYKDSCPTCDIQEAELEKIVDDYRDRVTFVRFKIREATMNSPVPEIMERYNLFWVPTTILLVNGKEVQRWVFNHGQGEFREALNKFLTTGSTGVATATGTPPAATGTSAAGTPICIPGQGCQLRPEK